MYLYLTFIKIILLLVLKLFEELLNILLLYSHLQALSYNLTLPILLFQKPSRTIY